VTYAYMIYGICIFCEKKFSITKYNPLIYRQIKKNYSLFTEKLRLNENYIFLQVFLSPEHNMYTLEIGPYVDFAFIAFCVSGSFFTAIPNILNPDLLHPVGFNSFIRHPGLPHLDHLHLDL
jgi:hypothetical protein